MQIPRAELAAYYAAAFEVWTRLLREGFMAHHGPLPATEAVPEHALLLAAVDAKARADGTRAVRMLGRPQLLHLRLLQEWLLRDGSQDAPREAHYLLGKGDPELDHAQDLLADFAASNHAMTRIDIVPDTTDGGSGNKARLVPAVKWPGGATGGGPDYYGPGMSRPIPVTDGGTGQATPPATGALLVGRAAAGSTPARFELGSLQGAALPKPVGPSPNILVDATSAAPFIKLDTVQDIGPGASPTFNDLTLTDDLAVAGDVQVNGQLSVEGELVLGQPLRSVLATDASGVVTAAQPWDGDEAALAAGASPPFVYTPGQPEPVRIGDGGTGLQQHPSKMQMLVGVPDDSTGGGHYVLATLVDGQNTTVQFNQVSEGEGDGESGTLAWQLRIDAQGGVPTAVVAAGGRASPANLTAVTSSVGSDGGTLVTIDTVQALHPGAAPRFRALSLTGLPQRTTPNLIGWDASTFELVRMSAPPPAAVDVGRWGIRYIGSAEELDKLEITDDDHVLVIRVNGKLTLPNLSASSRSKISEGRVIVVKAVLPVTELGVLGFEGNGSQVLKAPSSLTFIAATKLDPPQWLVIGRS
ncbi:hypothetical protein DBR42_17760 [Pelomonas sp. HMWF004]|nr:hypothetical protein DBR42_17760 [Pelomonas sp. HMWF004]